MGRSENVLLSIAQFKQKRKNALIKSIAYNFRNVSNGMVCTISFSNQNFRHFCVNGKRPSTRLCEHIVYPLPQAIFFFYYARNKWLQCANSLGLWMVQSKGYRYNQKHYLEIRSHLSCLYFSICAVIMIVCFYSFYSHRCRLYSSFLARFSVCFPLRWVPMLNAEIMWIRVCGSRREHSRIFAITGLFFCNWWWFIRRVQGDAKSGWI